MKTKLITLALCLAIIIATSSCSKVEPSVSGNMGLDISGTSVSICYTDAFSKNKKQEIILAFWDNMPRPSEFESGPGMMHHNPDVTCYLTKSESTVKFECVGKFDGKTGKCELKINGKNFDISNGRLFLINTHVKPVKVIQINEQFKLPPFDDLSFLGDTSFNKKSVDNSFSSAQKKFEYLAKNNKIVAAFLADSKKSFEKNKFKNLKKKD